MNGWTDRRMDGGTDRQTERRTKCYEHTSMSVETPPEQEWARRCEHSHLIRLVLMCFQSLSDPRFSFLNSYKSNLEERHLACGFKCTPRN